jgi:phosphoglucosamine mutase
LQSEKEKKLVFFLISLKKTPQTLENVLVKDRSIIKNPDVKKSIKKAEKLMSGHGRILVRASGTESKIRVMGESENKKLLDYCLKIILAKIK